VTPPDLPLPPEPEQPARAGLSLPLDIVVAPGRAFLKIARTNEWLPALAVTIGIELVAAYLVLPAIVHLADRGAPRPTQAEVALVLGFQALALPPVAALVIGAVLTAAARARDRQAPFMRYFSLAANCGVVSALGDLAHVVAVAVQAPASYRDQRAFALALPDNLGLLATAGNDRELGFLSRFTIFDAWAFVLVAYGLSVFAGVRFTWALTIAFALDFALAFLFSP